MHITPHLDRRAEFEALLKNYQMNSTAKQVLRQTPFVAMLALTSTGRNTIIRELLKTGAYYFIISDTTRPPRYNDGILEQSGVEYFFRTEEEMLKDIKSGQFVEAEVIFGQQVSGISIREIEKAYEQGKIAITDVDLLGSINIAHLKPDVISIALLPPDFEEWMRRIHKRTNVSSEELRRRSETAVKILEAVLQKDFYTIVVNDKLEDAIHTIDRAARLGELESTNQEQTRELAKKLLRDTREFLNK